MRQLTRLVVLVLKFCSPILHNVINSNLFYHLDIGLLNKISAINRCKSLSVHPHPKLNSLLELFQIQNKTFHNLPTRNIEKTQANHCQLTYILTMSAYTNKLASNNFKNYPFR